MTSSRDRYGYPDRPGFKAAGTSQQAAETIAPRAPRLRSLVLAAFKDAPAGMTADQAAATLELPILSVRPRVAELHRLGELRRTDERRQNASGMSAAVWRIADPLPDLPHLTDAPTIQPDTGRGE
jgi:hypothetical protein